MWSGKSFSAARQTDHGHAAVATSDFTGAMFELLCVLPAHANLTVVAAGGKALEFQSVGVAELLHRFSKA